MNFTKIQLNISKERITSLKAKFKRVIDGLEQQGRGAYALMYDLQPELTEVVAEHEEIVRIAKRVAKSGEFHILDLQHPDAEILNLPWGIAGDPGAPEKTLNDNAQIVLARNSLVEEREPPRLAPGPLKILVMISSPVDLDDKGRLHFEKEERLIIEAFEPLFKNGEVCIDFTDNGSIEALKSKVEKNDWHVLHFSGHGSFDREIGAAHLLLEDPLTLKAVPVPALDFAQALLKPGHTIPMVLLSSCQTAQADFEKGIAGVTDELLKKGIPAVASMGMSIRDDFATSFASAFYQAVAAKTPVPVAFDKARRRIREQEAEEIRERNLRAAPMQWLIPNLYLTAPVETPVDWAGDIEPMVLEYPGFLFENSGMERLERKKKAFVGRREDFARIMPTLAAGRPVMLKGQGGIGKTAAARKMIQRLIAASPDIIPLVFNEEGKEFSLDAVLKQLKRFCLKKKRKDMIDSMKELGDDIVENIIFLLEMIADDFKPLFFFDNVESFQNIETGEFSAMHESVLKIIAAAIGFPKAKAYVIITGRYPVKELAGGIEEFELQDVKLNDFIRKCYNLGLKRLPQARLASLFKLLGGNYRMLEFFHSIFEENEGLAEKFFQDAEEFETKAEKHAEAALAEMSEDILFDRLWGIALDREKEIATALAHYQLPVIDTAFELLEWKDDWKKGLERLDNLTLIQVWLDRETGLVYRFIPTLIKNLLEQKELLGSMPKEFHERAGRYHYYMFSGVKKRDAGEAQAAFWQFFRAGNKDRVNDIGEMLGRFLYRRSLYADALGVCRAVEELFGGGIDWWCGNRIGMIGSDTGNYDIALPYFEKALAAFDKIAEPTAEELENKGATLNNISQIYDAQGDYDTALKFLNDSLKIRQEIGDKRGEGATLNNISQIYDAQGDYETALKFLKDSLKILKEIGDKSGEGTTLNNISQIYYAQGDYETALKFLKDSLKILKEIGDKSGEGTTLNNISQIYDAQGDYDTALKFLKDSLKILKEIGDKRGEGATLNNISQIYYVQGDYETALKFLKDSLKILKEIGDKRGEGTTLNNISQIYKAQGDYETALKFLKDSLKIRQEIGDKSGEGTTLNNISQIYDAQGDYETALKFLKDSLKIRQEIGDKSGEGTTLNNIGQIYKAQGDYETALKFLKDSLKIRQEIGDKSGECYALHNIAVIEYANKNIKKYLELEMQAYKIASEIGDAKGLFSIGRFLGKVLAQNGAVKEAMPILQRSYEIGNAAGLPGTEEIAAVLEQLSE